MLSRDEALSLIQIITKSAGGTLEEKRNNGELELNVKIRSIKASPVTQIGSSANTSHPTEGRKRVLHVEDTGRTGDLILYYLRNTYDVEGAQTPEEALELAFAGHFDIVLMDMNLGGSAISGFELTKMLRKTAQYSETPILAITGYTSRKDIDHCLEVGCTAYLAKPFLKDDLLRVLREITA